VEHIVQNDLKTRSTRTQQGAALLIAIFTLMLISVVALAMILLASTESAIGGNYADGQRLPQWRNDARHWTSLVHS
jgi:Tfp pilus assembly protein PilX